MSANAAVSFLVRSRRYAALHHSRAIRSRTSFFFAAATVTRVFASTRATCFMSELSAHLEAANFLRAQAISAGRLYTTGSVARNTDDFVSFEQSLVEARLVALQALNLQLHADEIDGANRALHCLCGSFPPLTSIAHWRLARVVREVRRELGRHPDFGIQLDRERIGSRLASYAC